jgi:hypothetical protein
MNTHRALVRRLNWRWALALVLTASPWTAQAANAENPVCPMLQKAVALAPTGFASIEGKQESDHDGGAWISTLQFVPGSDLCSVDAGQVLRCSWGPKDRKTFDALVTLTADCFPEATRSSLDMSVVTSDPPWETFTVRGADISISLSFGSLSLRVASANLGR